MCSEMMNRDTKALFFDIDGTLLSEKTHTIPQSAVEALAEARRRGHLVFINTGRVYAQVTFLENQVETDGCLCGCGTTATRSLLNGDWRSNVILTYVG